MPSSVWSLSILIAFVVVGCGGEVANDFSTDAGPDADTFVPPAVLPPPCMPDSSPESVHHCGECDNRCPSDRSDRCEDGTCMCGSSLMCPEDAECRSGVCVRPDPDGQNCEFDDECPSGHLCIQAHCTRFSCEEEQCDGSDNDCDGFIDENSTSTGPLTEWCGPASTRPPCRMGHRVCDYGSWGPCVGAVHPVDEIGILACDGIDNNCDGCVDGERTDDGMCVRRTARSFDVLYVIDTSGSMSPHIARVTEATRRFSSLFAGRVAFRFAIATTGPAASPPRPRVVSDFADFTSFASSLVMVRDDGSGEEPTYDAVADACDNRLGLSWREGAVQIIILFTDEEGQSYRIPEITEADMCGACSEGQVLGFFSSISYTSSFDECGSFFSIYDDANFVENLESLISDPCSP